jgi:hypothetical protein
MEAVYFFKIMVITCQITWCDIQLLLSVYQHFEVCAALIFRIEDVFYAA